MRPTILRSLLALAVLIAAVWIAPGAVAQTAPTITTTSLPTAFVSQPYTAQLTYQASNTNYTWTITNGALPAGLTLDSNAGTISGTTTLTGTFTFTVGLIDHNDDQFFGKVVATQGLSITVTNGPLTIDQTNIPLAFQNTPYTTTLTASGGLPPYTWSFTSTSNDGLAIDKNSGVISGTPAASGAFTLFVVVNDSGSSQAQRAFTLNVATSLSITTSSLPNGTIGTSYGPQQVSAAGGQPPYRWSVTTSGSLPPGLTLDNVFGRISGTPTANGNFPFTLVVTDYTGNTANKALSITIGTSVSITTTSLPGGQVGSSYSQTLAATGGQTPYTWSIAAGSLPAGLTLSSTTGAISGTPSGSAGTANFTIQVTDAAQGSAQQRLSITITAPSLAITTTSLPDGTTGTAYSQTLAGTGGQTPYSWSVASGLPAGLQINATTGVISGTPTATGTSNFTVTLTDSAKLTAQQNLSITVAAPLSITPTTLAAATVGVAYTQTFTVAGGKSPYTFSVLGSLPAGFSFNPTTATFSGKAAAAESGNFTIMVTDAIGRTLNGQAGQSYTFTANNPTPPTVNVAGIPTNAPGFMQQLPVAITLASAYPLDISGSVALTFAPSVTPSAGVDDLLIQFSNGARVINFTIPAGTTTPVLSGASNTYVMTGTTAGTITLTTDLTSNGVDLGRTTKTIVNTSGVPFISHVTLDHGTGTVTVTVTGFSSTRDMTSGLFHFAPATGSTLAQSDVTVQLSSAFTTWWSNTTQSNPFGTEFTLTMPFTVGGNSADIVSVTVTLTNSKGASNPVSLQ